MMHPVFLGIGYLIKWLLDLPFRIVKQMFLEYLSPRRCVSDTQHSMCWESRLDTVLLLATRIKPNDLI